MARAIAELLVELLLQVEDFVCLNADVAGLAAGAAQGLVDHDPRVGEAAALALGASAKQKGTHRSGQTYADGLHIWLDVLHGVKYSQTVVYRSAWRIDVHENILLGIFCL